MEGMRVPDELLVSLFAVWCEDIDAVPYARQPECDRIVADLLPVTEDREDRTTAP
jgi:hypothetical protein